MYFNPFNLALVLCSFATLIDSVFPSAASPNYPGVIELVGYNDRRARTRYMPPDNQQYHSKSKMAADIETVKQNIEKYNKLLKMDTKNLPDSQKEILERIVERVARLKESIDISQDQDNATASSRSSAEYVDRSSASSAAIDESQETTLSDSLATSSESAAAYSSLSTSVEETTKNQDGTTTLDDASQTISTDAIEGDIDDTMVTNQDINASEEIATAKEMDSVTDDDESHTHDEILSTELSDDDDDDGEIPTSTTIGSGEMDGDQFVAARSNSNNNRRTLVSTSKTKSRPNSTKRPSSLTKLSTSSMKRVNGQKPSSMVGSSMKPTSTLSSSSSASSSSSSTATSSITTVQPMVKIQKPSPPSSIQQQPKEPSSETTMMKVQHQLPQKQQQQQLNKVQTYQAQPKHPQQEQQEMNEAAVLAGATSAAASSSMASLQQIEQKTLSTPPSLQQQQQQQQQQAAAIQIQQRTPIGGTIGSSSGSSITNTAGSGSLGSDMLYDSNVNTSSIIDSLNNAREEFYNKAGISSVKDKKTSATAKPTKYHYYPHNQHIYLLPECAIQQVCNAVYVRLNYTQPLCACPSRYRDPCSASLNEDDQHTTKLVGDGKKKAITLAKTCETINEMRECRTPKDWSLLALQNTRTGKSHYLVICRCPDHYKMEGPMAHDQPTYASVPGIRVFGMMCVKPGYQVRKPSVQPPKRYQLQKPYYIPNSQNKYSSIKDHSRPSYGGGLSSSYGGSSSSSLNYQPPPQHHTLHQQDSYQYLNRPESSSTLFVSSSNNHGHNNHNDYPESISFNGGIYGRNNERNGDKPIPAADEDMASTSSSSPNESEIPLSSSSISPISSEAKSEEVSRTSSAEIDESPTTLEAVDDSTSSRNRRSVDDFESEIYNDEDIESAPEFPWQKAMAFQQSIVWD